MTFPQAGLGLASLIVTGALGACNPSVSSPPVAAVAVSPAPLLPGTGCGPAITRTRAVVESDVATGNLNKPVGDRFQADLSAAAQACAAGRDREASGLLAAAKARYGYS